MGRTPYTVEEAIKRGNQIINRRPHPGYSMTNRGTTMDAPFYDCSSFMGVIWGVSECPPTGFMKETYERYNFKSFRYGTVPLMKGDILVWVNTSGKGVGHTAMICNNNHDLMHSKGKVGPTITSFYLENRWTWILRGTGGFYILKVENVK